MFSRKNAMLQGGASMDLGLGDQLKTQTEDEEEERKKKLMGANKNVLGPATMSLFSMAGNANGGI